jgi:hypothetical protein
MNCILYSAEVEADDATNFIDPTRAMWSRVLTAVRVLNEVELRLNRDICITVPATVKKRRRIEVEYTPEHVNPPQTVSVGAVGSAATPFTASRKVIYTLELWAIGVQVEPGLKLMHYFDEPLTVKPKLTRFVFCEAPAQKSLLTPV